MRNGPGHNRLVKHPLPEGPYVLIPQDDVKDFLKNYLTMHHEFHDRFFTRWGYVTFAINRITGEPQEAGSDYDSTD